MNEKPPRSGRNARATNILLTLNALLLGWIVMQNIPLSPVQASPGQSQMERRPIGLGNPTEQREAMIASLRSLQSKVDALTARLAKPIDVRVIQMPTKAD